MLRQGLVHTRFGVRIDHATGVAEDDTLREAERARAGLVLHSELQWPGEMPWDVEMVLRSGASLLTHIGSSRRRGAGQCVVTLAGDPNRLDLLLSRLESELLAGTEGFGQAHPSSPENIDESTAGSASAASTGEPTDHAPQALRHRARVTLTTTLPVLAARDVQGNTIRGLDHIPGALVLPVVARAVGPAAFAMIREARLVVTDATPAAESTQGGVLRCLKTPLHLAAEDKGEGWRTTGALVDLSATGPAAPGVKPVRGWCVGNPKNGLNLTSTALESRAHAVMDDRHQRPGEAGLYVYEAIPAGSVLAFDIWDDGSIDDGTLSALDGEVSFGRARDSDYGAATLAVELMAADDRPAAVDTLEDATLWLTSDALLLDDLGVGSPTVATLVGHLVSALDPHPTTQAELGAEVIGSWTAVVRRESWSAVLGLPRLSAPALAAGTVLRVRFTRAVARVDLERVLAAGVGQRLSEGMGRLEMYTGPTRDGFRVKTARHPRLAEPGVEVAAPWGGDVTHEAWTIISQQVWRGEILRRVRQLASRKESREVVIGPKATKAQVGTLRTACRALGHDSQALSRWVEATQADDARRRRWGDNQVGAIAALALAVTSATAARTTEVASLLNQADLGNAFPVPGDLAGVPVAEVVAAYLIECARQTTRAVPADPEGGT